MPIADFCLPLHGNKNNGTPSVTYGQTTNKSSRQQKDEGIINKEIKDNIYVRTDAVGQIAVDIEIRTRRAVAEPTRENGVPA